MSSKKALKHVWPYLWEDILEFLLILFFLSQPCSHSCLKLIHTPETNLIQARKITPQNIPHHHSKRHSHLRKELWVLQEKTNTQG